ncbi:MAG TPA: hypothetical protein VJM75_06605 [Acidimicrobiales bacterium]|nr:hypothetical protein [Acidimicrobiales bacterium]
MTMGHAARPEPAALERFLAAARATVGDVEVVTDPDLTSAYATDWTRR